MESRFHNLDRRFSVSRDAHDSSRYRSRRGTRSGFRFFKNGFRKLQRLLSQSGIRGSKPALLASNTFENARYDETFKNKNPYYNVYVLEGSTWKSVEVHNALCSNAPRLHEQIWNDWNNAKKLRDTMCYAQFLNDFAGPVRVRIEKTGPVLARFGYVPRLGTSPRNSWQPNSDEFSLPSWKHRKVSVEFDGDATTTFFAAQPARILHASNMQTDPPTVISKMVFTTSEEAKSTFSQKTPPSN